MLRTGFLYALPIAVLALLATACGDDGDPTGDPVDAASNTPDADPNAPDGAADVPDADPTAPDADPTAPDGSTTTTPDGSVGVTCGQEVCDPDTQECCTTFNQQGQQQQECVDTGTCESVSQQCDGPEDCASGEICCAGFQSGATCETECTGNDLELCHTADDCSTDGDMCCPGGESFPDYCSTQCFL